MSTHCSRPGPGTAWFGVSVPTGSEVAEATAAGKASAIRVPKASGLVRTLIGDANQSPKVYWQSGFARSALGSAVICPHSLLRPLGTGCPEKAAKSSIVCDRVGAD